MCVGHAKRLDCRRARKYEQECIASDDHTGRLCCTRRPSKKKNGSEGIELPSVVESALYRVVPSVSHSGRDEVLAGTARRERHRKIHKRKHRLQSTTFVLLPPLLTDTDHRPTDIIPPICPYPIRSCPNTATRDTRGGQFVHPKLSMHNMHKTHKVPTTRSAQLDTERTSRGVAMLINADDGFGDWDWGLSRDTSNERQSI